MKNGKLMKLLAMVTACVASVATMAAGAVSASATPSYYRDPHRVDLTLSGDKKSIANHTYQLVKLADYINVDGDKGTFGVSTVEGDDVKTAILNAAKAADINIPEKSQSDPMAWLVWHWGQDFDNGSELISPYEGNVRKFVKKLAPKVNNLGEEKGPAGDEATSFKLNVVNGIYLICDVTSFPSPTEMVRPVPMLVSTSVNLIPGKGTSEIHVKTSEDVPHKAVDKKTHKIGDNVQFTITDKVPLYNLHDKEDKGKYVLELVDRFSEGFTYVPDTFGAVATIDNVPLTLGTDYTIRVQHYNGDAVDSNTSVAGAMVIFDFSNYITNKINAEDYTAIGKEIKVVYYALLNENAKTDSDGNVNGVDVYYGLCSGETRIPGKDVYVFTGSIELTKKSQETGDVLPGAKFQVFEDPDLTTPLNFVYKGVQLVDGKVCDVYAMAKAGEKGSSDVLTTSADPLWIKGFDDGTYTFKETKAPDGYLLTPGFNFKVDVSHTVDDAAPSKASYKYVLTPDANKLTSIADNTNELTVVNTKSVFSLPATGAVGIIMRLVAGALVIGAALALFFGMRHLQRVRKDAYSAGR
ncbi:SpaA isopeptide-forming pilin-related protein [Bifidobacterium sp. ESL0764]|uniref:SpaA isopeptide-forming pilin-related protein n=1 Tax=Bifidobacterium sp. ESL0764 TaxID=2983228 RepID=UPI0023FA1A90|nr:SpaA isopeptide-forming pilin-related protein [Bifidobacterium sp. ESL0764]WEV65412.1 isopeptide-forming domain-containing fimbrial protein [Bifidobacterium sp. ESL0764]